MNTPMNDLFPTVSKADWIAQVNKDLKDPKAYDSLRWTIEAPEAITVEPFYTAEDANQLPLDMIQAAQKSEPGWLNAPAYALENASNEACRDALANGADALVLILNTADEVSTSSLSRLLNGIKLSETPVFFQVGQSTADLVRVLQNIAPYQLKGGLLNPLDATSTEASQLTADSPQFRTICVSGHDFHNAGATATQELAFMLARLADVYDQLTDKGLTADELVTKTILSTSVGTSYFQEIAKLRALRVLWQRFISHYEGATSRPAYIHCQTSAFYESTATPYTNMLRATTEAMAAVVGGCDVLTIRPYDAVFGGSTDFSQRIARNVSLLLKEESYFGKVADPSAGSYYIETLTHQLAESAWALFVRVEEMGGLARATDFVQAELQQAYRAKAEAIRNGNVLVGVTKFRFDEGVPASASAQPTPQSGRLASEFE